MNKKQVDLILQEELYNEISSLQKTLSRRDRKEWDFSETCNIIIRFCMDETYRSSENENPLFLKKFFAHKQKTLERIYERILLSAMCEDFAYINC